MKVYVINLDKNAERMKFMDTQLKNNGMDYERVSAVYGAKLSKEERSHVFCKIRSFLASGTRLRDGEIGCAISHCMVYKNMINNGIDAAVVLEDDIIVNEEISMVIEKIEHFMNCAKAQVFLLSSFGVPQKNKSEIEKIESGMCTDGYVITLPAARCIFMANYPVITVADKWSRWKQRFGVELYRVWPTVVCQDNDRFGTDIAIVKSNAPKGVRKLFFKICRVFELAIDWFCYKICGR